jgi:hypothetical protein
MPVVGASFASSYRTIGGPDMPRAPHQGGSFVTSANIINVPESVSPSEASPQSGCASVEIQQEVSGMTTSFRRSVFLDARATLPQAEDSGWLL